MPLFLSPVCNDQSFDANGDPNTGGWAETYLAGSSTPAAVYTDDTGGTPHTQPIYFNSLGYPTQGAIWLTGGLSYKFIIKNAAGSTLRTIDNISGVNDASVSQSEWVESGFVPTYINATSFSVPGDQTGLLQIGRRLRTTNTSGLVNSTISNSVFASSITTVTLTNDSTTLDAGLSLVAYALLAADPLSVPNLPGSKITGALTASGLTMTTARMLGRLTASTGAVEELTSAQVTTNFVDAASTAAAGKSELMTNAEAQAGTDTARVATGANLGATVLGIGQAWNTQVRAVNVTYTNSTGRPIEVMVTLSSGSNDNASVLINGVQHARIGVVAGVVGFGSFVIPNGATYRVDAATAVVNVWSELR